MYNYKIIFIVLTLFVFTTCARSQRCTKALEECKQNPSWVYESQRDTTVDILYDKGKYRVKHNFRDGLTIFYFDKKLPYIVWEFDPKRNTAIPSYFSCHYFLCELAKKEGLEKIRNKYGIEDNDNNNNEILLKNRRWPSEFYTRVALYDIYDYSINIKLHQSDISVVAGQRCDVFFRIFSGYTTKYYVESISHLVLRTETSGTYNPRIAPTKNISTANTFKFLKSIPEKEFQLPPGTTAILPKSMKDIPLPHGVTRKIMSGPKSELGFDIREFRSHDRNRKFYPGNGKSK